MPVGLDNAFAPALVANTAPAQDYTTGSVPGSPDAPAWPVAFQPVTVDSADGARLIGMLALHQGRDPGIVVVHGFNTHGNLSVTAGRPCSTRTVTTCSPPISVISPRSTDDESRDIAHRDEELPVTHG